MAETLISASRSAKYHQVQAETEDIAGGSWCDLEDVFVAGQRMERIESKGLGMEISRIAYWLRLTPPRVWKWGTGRCRKDGCLESERDRWSETDVGGRRQRRKRETKRAREPVVKTYRCLGWKETGQRNKRARKPRELRRREAQTAARITGSILSCDSSRFDYRALAFAPLQPTPWSCLPAAAPGDGLTSRAAWPLDRGIRIISRGKARPRLSINAQTRLVVARPSPARLSAVWSRWISFDRTQTRVRKKLSHDESDGDIGSKLSFYRGQTARCNLIYDVRKSGRVDFWTTRDEVNIEYRFSNIEESKPAKVKLYLVPLAELEEVQL